MYSDAHIHLHEVKGGYPEGEDVGLMFSCTADPYEWDKLKGIDRDDVKRFYGVHPWKYDNWSEKTRHALSDVLREEPSAGVGEIGLDNTRGILSRQIPVFCEQLDLATDFGRTVTVHMVGTEKETIDCLKAHAKRAPVVIHAFKSESYMKPLAALNCYFSINPRLLARKPESVRRIVGSIPRDRLLLESDAPHYPTSFTGMAGFVSELAAILDIDPDELAGIAYDNLRSIS